MNLIDNLTTDKVYEYLESISIKNGYFPIEFSQNNYPTKILNCTWSDWIKNVYILRDRNSILVEDPRKENNYKYVYIVINPDSF